MRWTIDLNKISASAERQRKVYESARQAVLDMGGRLTPKEEEEEVVEGGEEEEVVVEGDDVTDEGDDVTDEGDDVKADPEDGLPIPGEWYPGAGWKPDDSELGEHQSWIATSDTINGETVYKWEKVGETDAEYAARKQREALQAKNLELQQKNEALQYMGQENSEDVLRDLVRTYGLPDTITEFLLGEMVAGESELGIAQKIRARPEYAARFPAMAVRRELKLPAISEAEYIRLERDYRSIMRAANLPATFHDAPEDFTNLISGDVSAQEFQQRVSLAESALDTANQDIVSQLKDFYNLSDGDLTAYYLDPKAAQNIFEERRRYEAAGLSAASMQAVGEGLEVQTAEALQREDIQRREIQSRLGQRAGLTEDLLGSEGLSATDIAEAEFGLDVDEAAKMRRRREGRLAPMMGRGSALTTGTGISGLGAADT